MKTTKENNMNIIKHAITLSLLSSAMLLADAPDSSIIQRQIVPPKDLPKQSKQSVEIKGLEASQLIKDLDSSKTVYVKGFSFAGNDHISSEVLLDLVSEYRDRDLSYTQIQEVLHLVTKYYQEHNYFVARAYLTPQDLSKSDQILEISILEGKYGEFRLKNSSLVDDEIVQEILDSVKESDIISTNTIQRVTNLVNDRAGAVVTEAAISPGEAVGSSDFDIKVEATPRVDGYIAVDNYGSRYTGTHRLQGLININSPFGIGDKLSISGLLSQKADLKNARIAYALPLSSSGLRADVAYSKTKYDLVKEYKDLDIDGDTDIYEVGLLYPLLRSASENLYIKGKYYHKDMNDYMSDSKFNRRIINSFVASLDYDKNYSFFDLAAKVDANLNLTAGHLNSHGNNPDDGGYYKVDSYITNDIFFDDTFSLNTTLTLQKALGHKNLDGSEELSVGGFYNVKLYPFSEQSAENGYVASFELFARLPSLSAYNHKMGIFYDIGDAYEEINRDATFKRARLKDVGVGYYSSFDSFFLRTQMAWGANSQPVKSEQVSHKNSKFLFQAGWVF